MSEFKTISKEELLKKFPWLQQEKQQGQGSLSWRIKRLGKITGSKAKALGTTSDKPSSGQRKSDLITWIEQQNDSAAHIAKAYHEFEAAKGKAAECLSDLTKDYLSRIVDGCEGKVELTRGAESLLYELLAECMIDPENLEQEETPEWLQGVSSVATRWGHEYEPEAIEAYERKTGATVNTNTFTEWDEDALVGISPDGLFDLADGRTGAIEVKCPYNPANHSRVLIEATFDKKYMPQLLHTFVVCDVDVVEFVSYDPRNSDAHKLHIHRLNREDYADEIAQHEYDLRFFLKVYKEKMQEYNLQPYQQ